MLDEPLGLRKSSTTKQEHLVSLGNSLRCVSNGLRLVSKRPDTLSRYKRPFLGLLLCLQRHLTLSNDRTVISVTRIHWFLSYSESMNHAKYLYSFMNPSIKIEPLLQHLLSNKPCIQCLKLYSVCIVLFEQRAVRTIMYSASRHD